METSTSKYHAVKITTSILAQYVGGGHIRGNILGPYDHLLIEKVAHNCARNL